MNLLGENPATELEDINQEIADLKKDILAGVKAHWDVTELAEKVQELRSRKTEIEAGQAVEERDKERIKALRESIEKSKDKVHMKTSQFNIVSILPSRIIGTAFLFFTNSKHDILNIEIVLMRNGYNRY